MNVIPMITIRSNLLIRIICVLQVVAAGFHTEYGDNKIYHIPFNSKTNNVIGYTYIHLILFLYGCCLQLPWVKLW